MPPLLLDDEEGKWCWRTFYSGNDYFFGSSHVSDELECFTVEKGTATIITTSSTNSLTVIPGTSVSDDVSVTESGGDPVTNWNSKNSSCVILMM